VELYTSSEEGSQGGYDSELEEGQAAGRATSEEEEEGEMDESIASFSSSFSQNTSPADSPVANSGIGLGIGREEPPVKHLHGEGKLVDRVILKLPPEVGAGITK